MPRWTDVADWIGPTVNSGDGDGRPGEPEDRIGNVYGIVLHIQQGTEAGTESWQRNPAAQVSSHFLLPKVGRARQMVDTADRSWCQADGNNHWLSLECEGFAGDELTADQLNAAASIMARAHAELGVPLRLIDQPLLVTSVTAGGLTYHGAGGASWGSHYQCPGGPIVRQRAEIIARASGAPGSSRLPTAQAVSEEDSMAGGIPPRDIPLAGFCSATIWPVNSGSAGHGPAWINVCNDTMGALYAVRLYGTTGDNSWFPIGQSPEGRYVLRGGQRLSIALPTGTAGLHVSRLPADKDKADVLYTGPLTFAVEYGWAVRR